MAKIAKEYNVDYASQRTAIMKIQIYIFFDGIQRKLCIIIFGMEERGGDYYKSMTSTPCLSSTWLEYSTSQRKHTHRCNILYSAFKKNQMYLFQKFRIGRIDLNIECMPSLHSSTIG
jgi:hypothetical protein